MCTIALKKKKAISHLILQMGLNVYYHFVEKILEMYCISMFS